MAGTLIVGNIQDGTGTKFSFAPRNITTFVASGTWTKPVWCSSIKVRLVGGGGGGGAHGESGGGGYSELSIQNPLASVAVTIGGGGTPIQNAGGGAGNGSVSSFGAYCSASGGAGCSGSNGGVGGIGTGGYVNIQGGPGAAHLNTPGHSTGSNSGGSSYFGSCSSIGITGIKIGQGAPGSGGAGSGGAVHWIVNGGWVTTGARPFGLAGENGIVIVEEYN